MEDRWYFLFGVFGIIFILAIVFLSQQHFFDTYGKEAVYWTAEKIDFAWSEASEWFKKNIYPRVTKEIQDRGEPLKQEVVVQKDNAVKIIWENIKNFFAEKFSKVSGTKVE